MTELIIGGAVVSIVIGGIVEVSKRAGFPTKYAGLMAIGIGALVGVGVILQGGLEFTWLEAIVMGVVSGLVAAGAYSGGKAMIKKK